MEYAPEFSQELSKSYLQSIMGDIDEMGRVDEGRATAEQAARGTLGQQTADSAIGSVRSGVRRDKSRTIGQFNLDVAERRRQERLGEKSRGWSVEDRKSEQDFAAAEAEKSRAFQKHMAQLGYAFSDASARRDKISGQQGAVIGGLFGMASSGIGGYAGRF